jgi:helix-turn-helix protein
MEGTKVGNVEVEKLLDTREAAAYLKLSVRSLEAYRWHGQGPLFLKSPANGRVRYRVADLEKWLKERGRWIEARGETVTASSNA